MNEIFSEAKRLWSLGFAIHWLHPRSKRPIGNAWATGPRKSWEELEGSFEEGMNVGVRLGEASKLLEGFLCVIDVDVKSAETHHRKEAVAALKGVLGDIDMRVLPEVRSGRGNGSRHLYCVTKRPFKTWNPSESEDEVKVLMPSKSPSKRELAELTEKEIKKGWRLSKAWEISLYSDGRQVVLPPSVHPDTGKPYFWKRPIEDNAVLPVVEFETPVSGEGVARRERTRQQETVEDFEVDETLDVRWCPMDEATRALIVNGVWRGSKVEDRSAMLIPAAHGLVSAGLDKNGILTVLTDRSTYLGECAFEHAQTSSRRRAAQWLWNYTVRRVMNERDPRKAFMNVAVVRKTLGKDEAARQAAEIEADTPWEQMLERTNEGAVTQKLNNMLTILENAAGKGPLITRNDFANNDYYLRDTPWRSKAGAAIVDVDVDRIKEYCCKNWGVEFPNTTIEQALRILADRNRFHPVRDYLNGLEWDGVSRIETWLEDYANAEGEGEYLRAVSRKVLVALVKRIYQPGCKFDHVMILEGLQGVGKSTLLSNLVGDDWFTDQPLVLGDKDTVMTMQSKWLIELGELATLNRHELESMKAFIVQRTDRIRVPYGRRMEDFPRQCIFVGSTNQDEYLKDETGNRRFWPVKVGVVDFEGISRVRDQLFAEAVAYMRDGETLYLDPALSALAKIEQEKRNEVDEWTEPVRNILKGDVFPRNGFPMVELAKRMEQFGAHRLEKTDQQRIGRVLRQLGYVRFQEARGERRRLWAPKEFIEKRANLLTRSSLDPEPTRTTRVGSTKSSIIQDFY